MRPLSIYSMTNHVPIGVFNLNTNSNIKERLKNGPIMRLSIDVFNLKMGNKI